MTTHVTLRIDLLPLTGQPALTREAVQALSDHLDRLLAPLHTTLPRAIGRPVTLDIVIVADSLYAPLSTLTPLPPRHERAAFDHTIDDALAHVVRAVTGPLDGAPPWTPPTVRAHVRPDTLTPTTIPLATLQTILDDANTGIHLLPPRPDQQFSAERAQTPHIPANDIAHVIRATLARTQHHLLITTTP